MFFCIKLKGVFDPRQGLDVIHFIMKYFARLILHPLVRPFVLLFFGLTSTASLALLFRVKIGLEETLALPKVHVYYIVSVYHSVLQHWIDVLYHQHAEGCW